VSGGGWLERLGSLSAAVGIAFLIFGDHSIGWALLIAGGGMAGGIRGLGGTLMAAGVGALINDKVVLGTGLVAGGATIIVVRKLLLWKSRRVLPQIGALNRLPRGRVPVHAELSMAYHTPEGRTLWRRVTVTAVSPRGARDMKLIAHCHDHHEERRYRLSRVAQLVDLDTDKVIHNHFAYFRTKMAQGRAAAPAPPASPRPVIHGDPRGRPVSADLMVSYTELGGATEWLHLSVVAVAPAGVRDLAVTAICDQDGTERRLLVSRMGDLIDLGNEHRIRNKLAYFHQRMARRR